MGRYLCCILIAACAASGDASAQPFEFPAALADAARSTGEIAPLIEFAGDAEQRGDWDLAADALAVAVELRPAETSLTVRRAKDLYKSGPAGKPEAFKIADAVLSAGATDADALFLRGLLYLEQDMPRFAREDFDALLAQDPKSVPARIVLASMEAGEGRIAEAESRLAALGQEAMPYDAETRDLLRRALLRFERDRYTFADTAENHAAYARLLYRAARIPDAILAARRATALAPEDKELWRFLGQMHAQIGQQPQAEEAFRKAE
ncbi:MAG: hypothetical protein GC168_04505 [Candidatus Hydrogenedens sp.]|nr:hypothetical protein [Candidatus Hydrogenedens sp.]